ncbi:MAG: RHS repeat-associated core domain-containing protein [Candidatus Eremiobacteraeota bacterium]|nr:RHS repeat-associated core domain-containing protein [Candidatus Eremiobacteraeota bacterium]
MIPALLGLIAPVTAVKVFTQLARAAGAALRSATAPVALPVPPDVEKAPEVSEQISQSPVIFAYDGMSRRTKITELSNGTVTSKKLYWWLGGSIVCERDGLQPGFPITRRFFGQGEVRGSTKLYYAMDHLGSVRELVDSAGAVRAEYSYSTYGERNKEAGDLESEWGYAGLWHHTPSGLDLATYRLYDAKNRRWISRDPLGEGTDRTLYSYCFNSPTNFSDPSGLTPAVLLGAWEAGVWVVTQAPAILEGSAAAAEVVAPYAGSLVDFLPAWSGAAAGAAGAGAATGGFYLIRGSGNGSGGQITPPSGPINIRLPVPPRPRNTPDGWTPSGPVRPFRNYKQSSEINEEARQGLGEQYPHLNPNRWVKRFGRGTLKDRCGNEEEAEFHWYEHPDAPGLRHAFKFKRWL